MRETSCMTIRTSNGWQALASGPARASGDLGADLTFGALSG